MIHAAELPAGVFNLVSGDGPTVGEAIAAHPEHRHGQLHRLDARRAARESSSPPARVKRVTLELGGKSANVILDDADLDEGGDRRRAPLLLELRARRASRWTRMLVPRSKQAEVVALAKAAAESIARRRFAGGRRRASAR